MASAEEEMRAEFEKWARSLRPRLDMSRFDDAMLADEGGDYRSPFTFAMWQSWQAATASALRAAAATASNYKPHNDDPIGLVPQREFAFDRYRNGHKMAQGARVHAHSEEEARKKVKGLFHEESCLGDSFELRSSGAGESAEVPAPQPWISVEDRMPAENGEYLVMCEVGVDFADYFLGSMSWESVRSYGVYSETHTRHGVTHWMPLPAAPASVLPAAGKETK